MNRAYTPYDEEYGPKSSCDCCGKYRPLTFSVSFGIDTWACEECRGNLIEHDTHHGTTTAWSGAPCGRTPRDYVAEMEHIWAVKEKAKDDADSRDGEDVV